MSNVECHDTEWHCCSKACRFVTLALDHCCQNYLGKKTPVCFSLLFAFSPPQSGIFWVPCLVLLSNMLREMKTEMISVIPVMVLPLVKERGFCLRIVIVQHWVLTYSAKVVFGDCVFVLGAEGLLRSLCCIDASRAGVIIISVVPMWWLMLLKLNVQILARAILSHILAVSTCT